MPQSLSPTLEREIAEGLPRLAGARIAGTLPVSERLLNELIPRGAPVSELRLLDDDQFAVTGSVWNLPRFQVEARLVSVDLELNVTLELQGHPLKRRAFELVASRLPYVRRGPGRSLVVAAGALPAVARYRSVWRYLTHLAVRTRRGALVCDFAFSR